MLQAGPALSEDQAASHWVVTTNWATERDQAAGQAYKLNNPDWIKYFCSETGGRKFPSCLLMFSECSVSHSLPPSLPPSIPSQVHHNHQLSPFSPTLTSTPEGCSAAELKSWNAGGAIMTESKQKKIKIINFTPEVRCSDKTSM